MQKVFITGIAGFLGSHLAKKMFEAGWLVAGNDNFIGSDRCNLHEFVEFFDIDCCDLDGMQEAMMGSDLVCSLPVRSKGVHQRHDRPGVT